MFMVINALCGNIVGVAATKKKAFELADYTDDLYGQIICSVVCEEDWTKENRPEIIKPFKGDLFRPCIKH